MARTPGSTRSTSRDNHSQHATTPSRTPQSKHRLHFPGIPKTPNPASAGGVPTEHPVEVIGRIRDLPDSTKGGGSSSRRGGENQPPAAPSSALEIAQDGRLVRVRTDIGHRDFALDGVSVSEEEDLSGFYCRFVEPRVRGVRSGGKCTVMMYGPTGSGKSHTMFGCARQPGIVYRALKDIMGGGPLKESGEEDGSSDGGSSNGDSVLLDDGGFGFGTFVQVAVLEIYNEEIYDLLSGSSATGGLPKGPNTPKVRLEVMGKKAKNATYITGNEAGKLSREVAKVEKRRIVKSTLCNERSSRSHCLIILDVPSVGGRLMLVDMAGSENIEQAGQAGFEAKMQTGKINQGNIALKRVVESIANGDSHVPFRDSKLTMLLQDSFEDDKSKILMILCASPDPREIHRTLATLEYGAKAKCIIRAAHIPTPRHDPSDPSSANNSMLGARIVALNQFICNLQVENQLKEKQRDEAQKELAKKEEELVRLRARLEAVEVTGRRESIVPSRKEDEESIKAKVEERTLMLRLQVQRMEEQMAQQQHELETLRRRLGEMEGSHSQGNNIPSTAGNEESSTRQEVIVGSGFARRLTEIYGEGGGAGEQDMLKSMEIDMGDHDVKEVVVTTTNNRSFQALHTPAVLEEVVEDGDRSSCYTASLADENVDAAGTHRKFCLSTVFEEEEQEVEAEEEEVEKAVVEESRVPRPALQEANSPSLLYNDHVEKDENGLELDGSTKPSSASRSTRIQNIFRLCGNHRQLSHQVVAKIAEETTTTDLSSPLQKTKQSDIKAPPPLAEGESPIRVLSLHLSKLDLSSDEKENSQPQYADGKGGLVDVYVKWEAAAKDLSSGALVTKLKVHNSSTLADLRKVVEAHLIDDTGGRKQQQQQAFTFLLLGDPTGSPVVREKEAAVQVSKLPVFNNQLSGHLACLRPAKTGAQLAAVAAAPTTLHLPLGPLENKVPVLPRIEGFSS